MTDQLNYREYQQAFFSKMGEAQSLVSLFDYLPDVYFYLKNDESRFIRVNEPLLRTHGLTHEREMIGKNDFDFFLPLLAAQYIDEDRRVRESGKPLPNQVWLVPNSAGMLFWYLSSKVPIFDKAGKAIGISGAMVRMDQVGSVVEPYREMTPSVAYVMNHYTEHISIRGLAELTGLSLSQFDRRFKELFQMTPSNYIHRVRVNAARSMLEKSGESIGEIAVECGFYDQSHFTKRFKRVIGMSPSAYRKQYGQKRAAGGGEY
ncbi:MAG: AraC family transcriptional regulator [Verrucomicrobia bacterium]|nr:AraC family transcriptional regulator [Verrucomicrobiota bacterium]